MGFRGATSDKWRQRKEKEKQLDYHIHSINPGQTKHWTLSEPITHLGYCVVVGVITVSS